MCRVLRSTLKKTLNEAKKCVDVTADVTLVACHFQVNSLTITLILRRTVHTLISQLLIYMIQN